MWWIGESFDDPAYLRYAVVAGAQPPQTEGEQTVVVSPGVDVVAHNPGERLVQLMDQLEEEW